MFGLEYIMAGHLLTLAGYQIECTMKQAPEITVRAKGLETEIDTSKSIRDLNAFKPSIDTKSPYGEGVETHIEGMMHGQIGLRGGYMFATETYSELGKVCMYVSNVEVIFEVDPKIYIAREYTPGSCHYNAVLEHERKHVKVDRMIVNKYTNIVVKAVNNTLKKVGYVHGPYDVSQLPALQKQIGGIVDSVIEQFYKNMNAERKALQQQVDSLEEYRRVDSMCPDKPRPKF